MALLLITDTNHRKSPITNGGTEIQMELKFQHPDQQLIKFNQLINFISTYEYI